MESKVVNKSRKRNQNKQGDNKKLIILSIVLVMVITSICVLSFINSKLTGNDVNVSSEKIDLSIGNAINLSNYVNDIDMIKSYSLDNDEVISIDEEYNIIALQEGTVKLTVVYKDNTKEMFNIECSVKSSKATINGLSSSDQIHFISPVDATLITSQGKCGLIDMMYSSAPEYKKGPNDTDWIKLTEKEVDDATKTPEANTEYAIKINDEYVTIPQRPTSDGAIQNYSWKSGSKVAKYIKSNGCEKLDFVVMTHNHSDHIGGAKEIAAYNLIDENTIVFYKKDVIATENGIVVDTEENKNYYNNAYFNDAYEAFSSKGAHMCDVSAGCSNLFGDYSFIKGFNQDKNPFVGYTTNVDWTYYFDFGNFKINLYNLYHLANTAENMNSIVTLITHKESNKKAVIMGDQLTRVSEKLTYPNSSVAIEHPTGTCEECVNKGIENQIADVIGKVDLLRLGHHGHSGSNSYYMLNKFDASDVIISSGNTTSQTVKAQRTAMMKLVFEKRIPKTSVVVTGNTDDAVIATFSDNSINVKNSDNTQPQSGMFESVPNGWYEMDNINTTDNKIKIYIVDNSPVVGWKKIGGKWYYFNEIGIMQTGWQDLEWNGKKNKYYFDNDGVMISNQCITIDGAEYCFSAGGAYTGEKTSDIPTETPKENVNEKVSKELNNCVKEQQESKNSGKITDDISSIQCNTITEANKNNNVSRIHYLNLRGDAFVLESNGHFGLIDSSNPYNDNTPQAVTNKENSIDYVLRYLDALGVKKFDFIIATHSHSDHIGGMVDIAKKYVDSNTKYYYREYIDTSNDYLQNGYSNSTNIDESKKAVYEKNKDWYNRGYYCRGILSMNKCGAKLEEVTNKKVDLELGDFKIKLLNTEKATDDEYVCVKEENGIYVKHTEYNSKEKCNEAGGKYVVRGENKNSIVQLISYKDKKVLLTSDMEKEDEKKWVKCDLGKVNVLKLGNYGSTTSSSYEFMDYMKPESAFITSTYLSNGSANFTSISYIQKKYGSNIYLTGNSDNAMVMDFKDSNYSFKNAVINENDVVINSSDKIKVNFISKDDSDGLKKVKTSYEEKYVYLSGNKIVTNTKKKINGKEYSISSNGIIENIGWYQDKNKIWYYYNKDGEAQTGWQKLKWRNKESWFYFNKNGEMQTGWQKINYKGKNSWFYFNKSGIMQTGWQKINYKDKDSWFYFNKNGVMQTGWQQLEYKGKTNWYYFNKSGIMASDKCMDISGIEYCFAASGEKISESAKKELDLCAKEQQEALKSGKVTDDVASIACTNITETNKNNGVTRIHYINLTSDAIVLESNGHFGLIDSSNPYNDNTPQSSSNKNNSINRVMRYLDGLGVKKFDFVIATHSHSDHNGGMVDIAKKYVDSTTKFYYRKYVETANEYVDNGYVKDENGNVVYKSKNDWYNTGYYCRSILSMNKCQAELIEVTNKTLNLELGEFKIKIFNTEEADDNEYRCVIGENNVYTRNYTYKTKAKCDAAGGMYLIAGENKNSIIQLVSYKGKKVLLTGDMEKEDESKLINNNLEAINVLKLGHHGLLSATSYEFLDYLRPESVVITASHYSAKSTNFSAIAYTQKKYGSNLYLAGNSNDAVVLDFKDSTYTVKNGTIDGDNNKVTVKSDSKLISNFITKDDKDGLKKVDVDGYERYVYLSGDEIIVDTKKKIDNKYTVSSNGLIENFGWYIDDKGKYYYYNKDGKKQTGWQKINYKGKKSWFYFDKNGVMQTGWKKLEWKGKTSWYYFEKTGVMVSNKCMDIKEEKYCFDSSGVCISGKDC